MEVTSSKPIKIDENHQDEDVARELAFYQQALEAAYIARDKFKKLDIPFSRPDDYFAEMLKSDEHMAKVKKKKSIYLLKDVLLLIYLIHILIYYFRFANDY